MRFRHSSRIWNDFPELAAGALYAEGIRTDVSVASQIARYNAIAEKRLAACSEGELPEIRAWRRAFSRMGLKPTQYRCASEALLRRFKKEKALPRIHPLVDLCNAISIAFAIPAAALDVSRIAEELEVRHAQGDEEYAAFSGEIEHPETGEVSFVDRAGRAHARRWTNRQSAFSAVRDDTRAVLIVVEAMHETAQEDVRRMTAAIAEELKAVWSVTASSAILNASEQDFTF